MDVKIDVTEKSGLSIVNISGRIDSFSADDLKEAFNGIVKKKSRQILLLLTKLKYIDSSGIGSFMTFAKLIQANGGTVKLAEAPPQIQQVFELLSLDQVLDIYPTRQEALEDFNSEPSV